MDYMETTHYRVNKFAAAWRVFFGEMQIRQIGDMVLVIDDLEAVVQASAPLFTDGQRVVAIPRAALLLEKAKALRAITPDEDVKSIQTPGQMAAVYVPWLHGIAEDIETAFAGSASNVSRPTCSHCRSVIPEGRFVKTDNGIYHAQCHEETHPPITLPERLRAAGAKEGAADAFMLFDAAHEIDRLGRMLDASASPPVGQIPDHPGVRDWLRQCRADRERLAELLSRFAEFERDSVGYCEWCGSGREQEHAKDCIYPEVKAALAGSAPKMGDPMRRAIERAREHLRAKTSCPECGRHKDNGHMPTCDVQAALQWLDGALDGQPKVGDQP
jgi:hypothetical protein